MIGNRELNQIRVIFNKQQYTKKRFAEQIDKGKNTTFEWDTYQPQLSFESLVEIAKTPEIDIKNLLYS